MKYFRRFGLFMAVAIVALSFVSLAHATEKTRAALQTEFETYKLREFNAGSNFDRLINFSDSAVMKQDIVLVSGSTTFTCADNGTGAINYISSSASNATITLPAATGTGCGYQLTWDNVPTASGDIIQVTGNDEFQGVVYSLSDTSDNLIGWAAAAAGDNDQITYTSSTQMGATAGVTLLVRDVTTDVYSVEAVGSSTGTEVTPFATGQRP